jgi:hypothetical protein
LEEAAQLKAALRARAQAGKAKIAVGADQPDTAADTGQRSPVSDDDRS